MEDLSINPEHPIYQHRIKERKRREESRDGRFKVRVSPLVDLKEWKVMEQKSTFGYKCRIKRRPKPSMADRLRWRCQDAVLDIEDECSRLRWRIEDAVYDFRDEWRRLRWRAEDALLQIRAGGRRLCNRIRDRMTRVRHLLSGHRPMNNPQTELH